MIVQNSILFLFQFVKVGNAGSNFPSHIFPSLVGRPIIRSAVKVNDVEIKVIILHTCSCYRFPIYSDQLQGLTLSVLNQIKNPT